MGWRFPLKYANIAAYLTMSDVESVPRLTRDELQEFLGALQGEYRDRPPLISHDYAWINKLVTQAKQASTRLQYYEHEEPAVQIYGYEEAPRLDYEFQEAPRYLNPSFINESLSDMRSLLSNYKLFGLAVGTWDDNKPLNSFIEYAAYSSRHHALFLIPDFENAKRDFHLLDPFPAVARIAEQPESWPGVLFWTKSDASAFAPLDEAQDLYHKILQVFERNPRKIDEILKSHRSQKKSKKLLHLSDVHFGTDAAIQNEAYLSAHLETVMPDIDRIVITGDLFNNPVRDEAIQFRNFRMSLIRHFKKDAIVIPGNHDQKWFGNIGSPLREIAKVEWSNVVVDEDIKCTFFCFDSSSDANLARGKVSKNQMMEIATLFETKCVANPQIREFLSVALIHHHPFSFETKKETIISRWLERIGITDEQFLYMEDADKFIEWCARRNIPLILHGHKHHPRHVVQDVRVNDGKDIKWKQITAIGCGSSLGAEDKPLSYNILSWDHLSKSWSATFFADPGDGSGFSRQYVALHDAKLNSD